jgi:Mg/Co/Ni transporter MgtE
MKHNGIRRAPVIDDNENLMGIVTADDILEIISEQMNNLVGLIDCQLRNEHKMLA